MGARHAHKFQRLSDVAVFCPTCGEIKVAEPEAQCSRPHYSPWPYWYQPYTVPYVWPTPYWGTVTTSDLNIGTTFVADLDDTNVTYTLTAGTS